MIAAAIAACEVAFWVLLAGGLSVRYALGRARVGAMLLLCVPLVDVVLCGLTAIDLANGTRADWTHGLSAAYLGFSLAFGPVLIRSADKRFVHRFAGRRAATARQAPIEARLGIEWRLWARCVLACLLACAVLGALMLIAGDGQQSRALWADGGWFAQLGALCALWLLLGPAWAAASRRLTQPQGDRSS